MTTAPPTIRYTLAMPKPAAHLFEVDVAFDGLPADGGDLDLLLPVWRPGRYQVLDLAGGIIALAATDGDGTPLPWTKTEKSRWRVRRGAASTVRVRYTVFANEFQLRTRGLNDEHGFVDGAAVFLYAEPYRACPVALEVRPYGSWHVTTGMEGSGTRFTAPDYDTFIDCPLEIGNQRDLPFEVEGVPHIFSIAGAGNYDPDAIVRDVARIVAHVKAFWGSFPYARYVFLLHCSPVSGGGTEHANSTIMGTRPFVFRNADSYHSFLSLVAHEYFHTWNVKRLRPKGLTPYDYTKENYTGELWLSEGTTSYYDELLLVRAGLASVDGYLAWIEGALMSDRRRPGNMVQSVRDAGFDAWIKFSRATPQAYNTESDYYEKGAAVSLLLDLEIRHRSGNTRSLDDVLTTLARRFPPGSGFVEADILAALLELTGTDFAPFFAAYVTGVAPLPWERTLAYAGLEVVRRDTTARPYAGIASADADGRTRVTRVPAGSPAAEAGLDAGDEVVALNGLRVRSADIADRVAEMRPGDTFRLTIFRSEVLRELTIPVVASPVPALTVRRVAAPADAQRAVYESWLRTTWK